MISNELLRPFLQAAQSAVPGVRIYVKTELASHPSVHGWPFIAAVDSGSYPPEQIAPKGFGSGATPEEAIESFRASYRPAPAKSQRIAELKAELARLESQ